MRWKPTTRHEIVVAASFRTWPGWRQRRPPTSAGAYGGSPRIVQVHARL